MLLLSSNLRFQKVEADGKYTFDDLKVIYTLLYIAIVHDQLYS